MRQTLFWCYSGITFSIGDNLPLTLCLFEGFLTLTEVESTFTFSIKCFLCEEFHRNPVWGKGSNPNVVSELMIDKFVVSGLVTSNHLAEPALALLGTSKFVINSRYSI